MRLPETYKESTQKSGFTLIELLLVMALVLVVGSFTSSVGISYYRSHLLQETADNLVSTLRLAQGLSQSGKNSQPHGVFILQNSYVMFEGQNYHSRFVPADMIFPLSPAVAISGPSEIIFSELNGSPNVTGSLYITLGSREKKVEILPSGYIDK